MTQRWKVAPQQVFTLSILVLAVTILGGWPYHQTGLTAMTQPNEPIRIGGIYNVTGAFASIDAPGLDGMKLAARQINDEGGVLGRMIEIIPGDGQSDLMELTTAVTDIINTQQVVALGGLNDSTFALAAGPVAQTAGIPFVTSGATLPTLPEKIGDYFFMAAYGDDDQATAVANFAFDDLHARTAYLLVNQDYDYTTALAEFFKGAFIDRGGSILLRDDYPFDETDFSAYINHIKMLNPRPDVLFVAAVPDEAGLVTQQIRAAGLTQPILSGDGFDTPLIAEVAGLLADDVYFSTHVALDNPSPKVQAFVHDYRAEYERPPENAFAALGYDTMNLLADAIKRAGSTDPAAIRDALAMTRNFEAVTGTISYEPGKRKPIKHVTIIRIQDGVSSFVKEVLPMMPVETRGERAVPAARVVFK